MVYYSSQARLDLANILIGLLEWRKHILEIEEVIQYVDDIADICDRLDINVYHANAQYDTHKRYGTFAYPYKRNKNTTWYIIYNIDETTGNIYINKIMNNYLTIQ
jgi:hypothetical protein